MRGDRRDRLDDAAVHALARAITAEREEGAGVAMYLALADLAPADRTDPTAGRADDGDGAALVAEPERWHALLGLDGGSDAVQHVDSGVRLHLSGLAVERIA